MWVIGVDLLGFLEEAVEDAGDWSEQFAVGLGPLSDAKHRLEGINLACYVLAVRNRQRLHHSSFISLLPTNVKTHSPLHMTRTYYDYVTR